MNFLLGLEYVLFASGCFFATLFGALCLVTALEYWEKFVWERVLSALGVILFLTPIILMIAFVLGLFP